MKMMSYEKYAVFTEYLNYMKENPSVTPARREINGAMYIWVEDVSGRSRGFWLSEPKTIEPTKTEINDEEVRELLLGSMSRLPTFDEFAKQVKDDTDDP